MAAATAAPAWADCAPENVGYGGTVTCSGVDPDGLIVSAIATVRVEPGAQILAGADAAIYSTSQYSTLINYGAIVGGATPGVLITGAGEVAIGVGASITGSEAIRLQPGYFGQTFANVSNGGQLLGTGGAALVAEAGTFFNLVDNGAGATIGGVRGRLNGLRNAGTIDGGAASAIAATEAAFSDNFLFNAGTIRSAGAVATMDLASRSIGNEGRIENAGAGAAIASNGALYIENRAGGRIASAGAVAIQAAGAIQLTNAGTIVGSVVSTAAAGNASVIDSSAGTIQGDLLLGAGDDMLVGGFDLALGRVTAVTGIVDGGAGFDTVAARIATDTTIQTFTLPTNFERLRVDLTENATVQLAGNVPLGLALGGYGTFRVLGDVTTTGPAFSAGPFSFSGLFTFENQGSITADLTSATQAAVDLNAVTFLNSGRITANGGDGVRVSSFYYGTTLTNDGTITASGTAVSAASSEVVNHGVISSSGGLGLTLSSFNSPASENSGTISGGTIGVRIEAGRLSNGGTISGPVLGIDMGTLATVENLAGGTISGGSAAIDRTTDFANDGTVRNAGTINGDIDLSNASPFDFSNDVFVNDGGIVNGSVRLGGGDDIYASDLGASSGVTGTIDGGDGFDIARFRVRADSVATLAVPISFEGVDYELIGDVALSLAAPAPQNAVVSITGVGRADISADLVQAGRTLLNLNNALAGKLPGTVNVASDLDVISRGTLTLTPTTDFSYSLLAAVDAGSARFENKGTISVAGSPGGYSAPAAIANGSEVINSGTILLDEAVGVRGAAKLINSGSIMQLDGGGSSIGVTGVTTVQNSGTIRVDDTAVSLGFFYNGGTITNSGLIESRTTTAINAGSLSTVANLAGGTIRGVGSALYSDGGVTVTNQGAIVGDVVLGTIYAGYYGGSRFVSDGGTVSGGVSFGTADDLFLQRGATTGVSGAIDGGDGTDTFGRSFDATATTMIGGALPTNFERELIEARGAGTIVTLTAGAGVAEQDLYLAGDGSIVGRADMAGTVHLGSLPTLGYNLPGSTLGAYTNEASIGSVEGVVARFANNGTIGAATLSGAAVDLDADGTGRVVFANSGTILNDDGGQAAVRIARNGQAFSDVSFANSGTITGQVFAGINFVPDIAATLAVTNEGTIRSAADSGTTIALAANNSGSSIDPVTGLIGGRWR